MTIESVSQAISPIKKVKAQDYIYDGKYPVIDQGQDFIGGYTNEEIAFPDGEYIIFGDHTCITKYVNFPFAQGADGVKVIKARENVISKYLYYVISNIGIKTEYARHWAKMRTKLIPVPPMEVQKEIVRILDNFAELTTVLTVELAARKKQYEYYTNKLLYPENNKVPYVKLKDIAIDIYRGSGIKREHVTEDGIPCVRYGEIYTTYDIWFEDCVSYTQLEYTSNPKWFEYGDILFAITGESVEDIAKSIAYVGHKKCMAGGDIVVMKHTQNPKYLAYALSTYNVQKQKSKGKVKSKVVHSDVSSIEKIEIPLPSIEEQGRIVDVLDNFKEICFDLNIGLPAEINARRKQYEYYRDKLLAFKTTKA